MKRSRVRNTWQAHIPTIYLVRWADQSQKSNSESRVGLHGDGPCRTLQELIAPDFVRFYSRDWTPCGSRTNLASPLHEVTNIDLEILRRSANTDRRGWLHSLSVSKRMSWASKRQTTRREDEAYCLLGLFGVSMPMLYGEGGPKASSPLGTVHFHRPELTIFGHFSKAVSWPYTPPPTKISMRNNVSKQSLALPPIFDCTL